MNDDYGATIKRIGRIQSWILTPQGFNALNISIHEIYLNVNNDKILSIGLSPTFI